jgi:hypothetical protein
LKGVLGVYLHGQQGSIANRPQVAQPAPHSGKPQTKNWASILVVRFKSWTGGGIDNPAPDTIRPHKPATEGFTEIVAAREEMKM